MNKKINYTLADKVSNKDIFSCSFQEIRDLSFEDYFQSRLFYTSRKFKEPLLVLTLQSIDFICKPIYWANYGFAKYLVKRLTQ